MRLLLIIADQQSIYVQHEVLPVMVRLFADQPIYKSEKPSKNVTVTLAHPAFLLQGQVLLGPQARLANQAAAFHCFAFSKFQTDYAAHRSQNTRSWLNPLVVINLNSATPHRKVAFDVLNTPLLLGLLTTRTCYFAQVHYPFTKCCLHILLTVAVLATQLKSQYYRGVVGLDKLIWTNFFKAVSWTTFRHRQSREQILRRAVKFALAIRRGHPQAILGFSDERYLIDQSIELIGSCICLSSALGLNDHTLMIQGELKNG